MLKESIALPSRPIILYKCKKFCVVCELVVQLCYAWHTSDSPGKYSGCVYIYIEKIFTELYSPVSTVTGSFLGFE